MKNIKYIVNNAEELAELQKVAETFLGCDSDKHCTISKPYGISYHLDLGEDLKNNKVYLNSNLDCFEIRTIKEENGYTHVTIFYRLDGDFGKKVLMVEVKMLSKEISFVNMKF